MLNVLAALVLVKLALIDLTCLRIERRVGISEGQRGDRLAGKLKQQGEFSRLFKTTPNH
jgi:hypothetical protein